jgi:hypothetical protein
MASTDHSTAMAVLKSSTQLFVQARNAVARCVQLNAGQTLFALYKEITTTVEGYIESLTRKLPQPSSSPAAAAAGGGGAEVYPVTEETAVATVEVICLTINTTGLVINPFLFFGVMVFRPSHHFLPADTSQSIALTPSHNWPTASGRS